DDNKRPEEEIEQDLIDRGNKKMEDMQRLLSFEAEILTPVTRKSYEYESGYLYHAQPRRRAVVKNTTITPFEYEVDFNIGDIVDVFNKKWGVSLSTPIVEILEIHEQGGFRIEATFGDTRPTITKKLKKRFDDIEDIDKQEKYNEYVNKKIEQKAVPQSNALWTGAYWPNERQIISPTKNLSECVNGWVLQWQRYIRGEGLRDETYTYTYIPKIFISEGKEGYGSGFNIKRWWSVDFSFKYLYIYNGRIKGHDNNLEYGSEEMALTGVFEW